MHPGTSAFVASWRPRTVSPEAARFAREVVGPLDVGERQRAKALLYAVSQLGRFAESVGLELDSSLLNDALVERFVACGCGSFADGTVRTLRANLRFVATAVSAPRPKPPRIARGRAKPGYSDQELAAYLALADTQPTVARRQRASGLIALGAGAGLLGVDLRTVRGTDVVERSGGVLVEVHGPRARVVPVHANLASRALLAARHAAGDFVVGGHEPNRRNVTTPLIASLSGGADLPRLELSRLRATWLALVASRIGLATFLYAAGVTCSQHLGDVAEGCPVLAEHEAVELLAGS